METVLHRALVLGAEGVALTGSTVRAQRTAISDLDLMVVGRRPDLGGIREDIDVYATDAKAFWERLRAGDDYIQWTLRFGCILYDEGILYDASRFIDEHDLAPSAERKLTQARRGLSLAQVVLESDDVEAGREAVSWRVDHNRTVVVDREWTVPALAQRAIRPGGCAGPFGSGCGIAPPDSRRAFARGVGCRPRSGRGADQRTSRTRSPHLTIPLTPLDLCTAGLPSAGL